MKEFQELKLQKPIIRALQFNSYEKPTPIQAQSIPVALERKDIIACAQTGTGKTAAFALPILQMLMKNNKAPESKSARVLILAPTRELAGQIDESFRVYGRYLKISRALIYGGVKATGQIRDLRRGVDILIATPGRLLDLFNQGKLRLDKIEVIVLDEADRMLDMGFLPDVRKIYSAIPEDRQSMLFSATFPDEIRKLTRKFLNNPVYVAVSPPAKTVEKIDQKVLFVDKKNKKALLKYLLQDSAVERALVFTRTKHGANQVAKSLNEKRKRAEAIHGNKSQGARLQALKNFRSGKANILVATDLASRGLDIDGITHVINFELPNEAESYVHRIGRTGRAGAVGVAISFCDFGERSSLLKIQKKIAKKLDVITNHSFHSASAAW